MAERTLQPAEPALLPLVAERPNIEPARVAERGNKQEQSLLGGVFRPKTGYANTTA
jgi:hypothetical protein